MDKKLVVGVWDDPRSLQIDSFATGVEQAGMSYVVGDEIIVEYTNGYESWRARIKKPKREE